MKKLFFSLLAFAATLTASAQNLEAGDYYLRNVESGKYIAWGHNWGTRSVLTEHGALLKVTLNNGKYTLKNTTGNTNYGKAIRPSDGFADQSGEWTVESVGDGTYKVKGSEGYYRYDGTPVPVVNGTEGQTGIYWEFLTKAELTSRMTTATASDPKDATHFIKSPDFLNNDYLFVSDKAWGINIPMTNGQPHVSAMAGSGNTLINNANCEIWNNTNSNIKQTLTGLPKGTYKLSCYGLYRDGGPADAASKREAGTEELRAFMYAGDAEVALMSIIEFAGAHGLPGTSTSYGNVPNSNEQAAQHFEQGDYVNELFFHVAEDNGSVTIGIRKDTKAENDWTVFDNFDLKYFGDCSITEAQNAAAVAEYRAALESAQAIDQTAKMNTAALAALTQALNDYAESKVITEGATKESIAAAAKALSTAAKDANESITLFANAKVALDAQKALMDGTNIYNAEGFAAYQSAWTTNSEKYENNTLTNQDGVVNPNIFTGWHASTAYNFLLTPWTVDGTAVSEWSAGDNLHMNTWSTEGDNDGSNFQVPFLESWIADASNLTDKVIATQVTDLPNGLYSVSALVRTRTKNGVAYADAAGITLTVNEGTPVDIAKGTQINTGDRAQFGLNTFTAEALVKDGILNITIDIKNTNISWLSFKNVKYTKVRDLTPEEETVYATPEEIAALNTAIETAEANTIGFEEGEYAPYTNVVAIATLKAAKAINTEDPIAQETVVNATTALTNATWTPNTEEMNAVYDGTFANAENDGAPAGWTMSNNTLGGSLHSRVFVGDNRLNEFNETGSGFFLRFDGTNSNRGSMYYYGRTEGYEMPLKANTKYYVSVDFAGWGSTGKPLRLNVTGPEGFTTVYKQANTSVKADTESKDPQNHYIEFTTGPAGNYQINFQTPGPDTNTHNVIVSNIVLKSIKEVEANLQITEAGVATFCAPFDVALNDVEGVEATAYTAEVVDGWVALTEVEGNVIPAGTAVVLQGTAMEEAVILTGIPTADEAETGCLVGNLDAPTTVGVGNYLLQKQTAGLAWYLVDGTQGELKIGTNRCYLTKEAVTGARTVLNMDLNPTGIDSIATEAKTKADGKYLVNGRIVIVKSGKVYELK